MNSSKEPQSRFQQHLNQIRIESDSHPQTVGSIARQVESQNIPQAVYMHIPFCFHKCHYCDFYSVVDHQNRQSQFTDRLLRELSAASHFFDQPITRPVSGQISPNTTEISDGQSLKSLFVGGGTPTLLNLEYWDRILPALAHLFRIDSNTEFTVEANPETVTPELMSRFVRGGVNRISIGAQSFDPALLKILERWHDPHNVDRAVEISRNAGISNINIDLIFGIPGQSIENWLRDLDHALSLQPTHLSCYALTYEPGTAMTARKNAGEFRAIDEKIEVEMFLATRKILADHGFDAYEISNFALQESHHTGNNNDKNPDFRCQHNLAYWRNENWFAIGPAASGHWGASRWKNIPHLQQYLTNDPMLNGLPPIQEVEHATLQMQLAERMMMGFRLAEGLELNSLLSEAAQFNHAEKLQSKINQQIENGMMEYLASDSTRLALTSPKGLLMSDTVIGELMSTVYSPDADAVTPTLA